MSSVSNKSHPAIVPEVVNMWDVPGTQETILNYRYDVYPSSQPANASPDIEFSIPEAADSWMTDLSQSYVKYTMLTSVDDDRVPAADSVFAPLPGLGNVLWERAALTCNGAVINDESSAQWLATHVHNLVNKSRTEYLTDAHAWLPTPGEGGTLQTAILDQKGYAGSTFTKIDYYTMPRLELQPTEYGKTTPLGDLFGVAAAKRYWPDRCAFRMRLTRLPDEMISAKYGNAGELAKLVTTVITKAEVHIRRVQISAPGMADMMAEFALGNTVSIPHINARVAQVNFNGGSASLVARSLLPGARPTRVIAFLSRTSFLVPTRGWNDMPFIMNDPLHAHVKYTRAWCEVGGNTYPQRYLTSSQSYAPMVVGFSNLDISAAYQAYRHMANPGEPVLSEIDFLGQNFFCFDTSLSGSGGEGVYDPSSDTDISVSVELSAATVNNMTMTVISYTPRVIDIDAARTVTRT